MSDPSARLRRYHILANSPDLNLKVPVRVRFVDDGRPFGHEEDLGWTAWESGHCQIYLRSDLDRDTEAEVFAHEVGHIISGHFDIFDPITGTYDLAKLHRLFFDKDRATTLKLEREATRAGDYLLWSWRAERLLT